MKVYNTIIVYDCYVVSNDPAEARAALLAAIREGEPPSEEVALESREERNVRQAWTDKKPFVANDVSDDDFEKLKGKTTIETYRMIYTKEPPK